MFRHFFLPFCVNIIEAAKSRPIILCEDRDFMFLSLFSENKSRVQICRIDCERIIIPDCGGRPGSDSLSVTSLAASISKIGLLQPLLVVKNRRLHNYTLLCGRRRLLALKMLGLKSADCIVLDSADFLPETYLFAENFFTYDISACDFGRLADRIGARKSLGSDQLAETLCVSPATLRTLMNRKEEPRFNNVGSKYIIKDLRLFHNSLKKLVATLISSGLNADLTVNEEDDAFSFVIKVSVEDNVSRET